MRIISSDDFGKTELKNLSLTGIKLKKDVALELELRVVQEEQNTTTLIIPEITFVAYRRARRRIEFEDSMAYQLIPDVAIRIRSLFFETGNAVEGLQNALATLTAPKANVSLEREIGTNTVICVLSVSGFRTTATLDLGDFAAFMEKADLPPNEEFTAEEVARLDEREDENKG